MPNKTPLSVLCQYASHLSLQVNPHSSVHACLQIGWEVSCLQNLLSMDLSSIISELGCHLRLDRPP